MTHDLTPTDSRSRIHRAMGLATGTISFVALVLPWTLATPRDHAMHAVWQEGADEYDETIRPILERYCIGCHGPEKTKGRIRFDTLDHDLVNGSGGETWNLALDVLQLGDMPPKRAPQPKDDERRALVDWIRVGLQGAARAQEGERHTVLRRLNKTQYTNTLQELLDVSIEFGRVLPDDGKSKMGFSNDGETLQASALHLETYQAIARDALDQAIAVGERPEPTRYRVTFGQGIGRDKVAGHTGGYQSVPLDTNDFVVDILDANGQPKAPHDDAQRAAFDAVRRKISIGLRGSSRERFRVVDDGVLLYGALPHVEKAPGSWQGPSPNLKLEMQRVFPERGDFVLRVRASRGDVPLAHEQTLIPLDKPGAIAALDHDTQALLTPADSIVVPSERTDKHRNLRVEDGTVLRPVDVPKPAWARCRVPLPTAGIYQVDLVHPAVARDQMPTVRLKFGRLTLDERPLLSEEQLAHPLCVSSLGVLVARGGTQTLEVGGPFFVGMRDLVLTPLPETHPIVKRLTAEQDQLEAALEDEYPALRALVGTRTDDGMDYATFDEPQVVEAELGKARTYTFRGRLENLPIPEPESGDTEILSGFLLIGVWNDHLVTARDDTGPPLLVQSMEVEAPYFDTWPPASHRAIFIDSDHRDDEVRYTREVLTHFMQRAFRRPIDENEVERYLGFWHALRPEFETYEDSVREVLVAVLCSPNFLYLAEPQVEDEAGDTITEHALATRLAYFLWNSPPDDTLQRLAAEGSLRDHLDEQIDRMIEDARSARFVRAFTREWLRLDRHESMTVDPDRFPRFTRFVKRDMAEETYRYVQQLLLEDLPVFALIDSDFAMLNDVLADYYGVDDVIGPHFRKVHVTPEQRRAGLLVQGSFLSGHSNGQQPHPIKRAVWLKEKLLGERPPTPPPNVPALDKNAPGAEKLTLKEQLEQHRKNPSCTDCHLSIDPYGVVFERFNAGGLFETTRLGRPIDTATTMPDGTAIDGVDELKAYLLGPRRDDFVAAVIEHLFAYALGRVVGFADEEELAALQESVARDGFTMRSLVRHVIRSRSFQTR
ncbi:MAG: DUF1592 domain-containing protein [Planctomycetes bacterium]|nr:DUF1592 domain-containing protein [Planctomycetota bacterium]MCB9890867.1 DUF1592 domain-containing protein [Planctomycetota bacterium]